MGVNYVLNLLLLSICSPKNEPARTVKTNVREFVMGTANDNSVKKKYEESK